MTPRLSLPPVLERCGDLRAFGESSARGADRNRSVPSDLCLRGTWSPFPAHGHARGAPECLLTVEGALSGVCMPPHQSSRDGHWERAFSTWACSSEPPGLQQARINHRNCTAGAQLGSENCRARPGRVTVLHRTSANRRKSSRQAEQASRQRRNTLHMDTPST